MNKKGLSPMQKALVRRETISAYLFLLPALIFFLGFVIVPMILCLVTSFFSYTMTEFRFVGFENYVKMFQDEIFIKALFNTVLIVVVSVPAGQLDYLQTEYGGLFLFPVHLLPAGSYGNRSCYSCLEVDV